MFKTSFFKYVSNLRYTCVPSHTRQRVVFALWSLSGWTILCASQQWFLSAFLFSFFFLPLLETLCHKSLWGRQGEMFHLSLKPYCSRGSILLLLCLMKHGDSSGCELFPQPCCWLAHGLGRRWGGAPRRKSYLWRVLSLQIRPQVWSPASCSCSSGAAFCTPSFPCAKAIFLAVPTLCLPTHCQHKACR